MWPFKKKPATPPPVRITDSPCDPKRQQLINTVTKDAAGFLDLDLSTASPAEVVKKVDSVIVRIVFGEPQPVPETEEKHLILGSLWGAQMVKEFGWAWADVRNGEAIIVGVVSPQKDMVIHPFNFVADCIAKRCVCTVELSFNMLLEKKGAAVFSPGSYENVMLHIHHIVPPYTLEAKG